ncbi:DUF2252 domain-containing protein [Actinosynnema sp. NPDC047251]|uniref:DUF2252 domain-containing protein n=1 Tax=Saccharothrix espanaensis (strain ATCC 51144 / DSM 44229 / JCM 9112 / NBRC 15066 / NRRL 15764) TaxID=1179773 RepID=K0JYE1_SACES|nr:DUF2252 domain-containing protein [Saccharothrix espanaensis]CCH29228.1 hypothetical protein BN6_19080 [Saccharothrix espanaensis DSM 44229]
MGEHRRAEAAVALGRWTEPEEVLAEGRRLRAAVSHEAHRALTLAPDRPSVVEYVEASNEGRLPHLVPLRIGRMLASPFAFFRGSAGLMAGDLAVGPRSGLDAQLCGDAHAANFGLYGTPDGQIVMDINDFDETLPGPWEWDLKRLVTSLVLAGRAGGVSEKGCRDAAGDAVRAYRGAAKHLAEIPFLESWSALGDESVLSKAKADDLTDEFSRAASKARKNTSAKVAAKWTRREGGHWRFVADPPVLTRIPDAEAQAVIDALPSYVDTLRESRYELIMRYGVSDVAFRVVGTGSVGLRNYLVLLHGNGDEALILQVKEARRSALAPFLDVPEAKHEGKRIVHGARLVQAETDILLGWTTIGERHFIVRQFRNRKGEIDATTLKRDDLDDYGRFAGALLARAHSRSVDPRLLAGYCAGGDDLDEAFTRYAVAYADQTAADHERLAKAVKSGRLAAHVE